ncbi:MAG: class IV adenylate cyclase [Treponema sp.]|jgi:adenylate cyclase class 2|nr:class IV adenylate cyclase [Treponema sp.]
MAVEIELKAWADNPGAVREKLDALARFNGEFLKEDTYWKPEESGNMPAGLPFSGVRIRKERGKDAGGKAFNAVTVTYKSKEMREGLEVNDEREFSVSDAEPFEELLRRLGLKPAISKRKSGFSWDYDGITAELAEVAGLGWFAELEVLSDNSDPETVGIARRRLLGLLSRLGIGEGRIEARYYTEMLQLSSLAPDTFFKKTADSRPRFSL